MELLIPGISMLFEKTNYTAPVNSVVNRIIEYDMKSAGFSVCKKYKLLDKEILDTLARLSKVDRNIQIGKLRRDENSLSKSMANFIKVEKMWFFMANDIQDEDVLSIKNDAIFLIGIKAKKRVNYGIEFVEKNRYSSFLKIDKIEFYYNRNKDILDVKGISDDVIMDHQEGMVKFFKELMTLLENGNPSGVKKFIIEFSEAYKERRLPITMYRTFNSENIFEYQESGELDIRFNYLFYIIPLLRMYLF